MRRSEARLGRPGGDRLEAGIYPGSGSPARERERERERMRARELMRQRPRLRGEIGAT